MEKVNLFGTIALGTLFISSVLNLLMYPVEWTFAVPFFIIPVFLGAYGVLFRSRAFILSGAFSLLFVSLRPNSEMGLLSSLFLSSFIIYFETAEASLSLDRYDEPNLKRNYMVNAAAIVVGSIAFALMIFYFSPFLANLLADVGGASALLDTIYLPMIFGLVILGLTYLGSLLVKG